MPEMQILVVEDDHNMRFVLDECLKRRGYQTLLAADGEQALRLFTENSPDLVILDFKIPKLNGMEVLEYIKKINQQTIVIILTGHATINIAVDLMKKGAYDFITKPFEVDELLLTVENAVQKRRITIENMAARESVSRDNRDVYYSACAPSIKKINKMIENVASSDFTVLLEGESGTGKSLLAKEIHDRSERKNKPFVCVDCAALPASLVESELFGYEKGAFTGAINRKIGKIGRAHGGTLFLDEISTLDYNAQAALLSVIQNRQIELVGGSGPQEVDVRIIAASNRNLKHMVKDKEFRHDLYYRIKVFTIVMPSLKERSEDIIPLSYFFINKYSQAKEITLSPEAAMKLKGYDWPGNIRELENAIKHALILVGKDSVIQSDHLPLELNQGFWAFREQNMSLKELVEATEKNVIQQTLLENDLNIEKCAKALKISKRTLYYRIKKLGIDLGMPKD